MRKILLLILCLIRINSGEAKADYQYHYQYHYSSNGSERVGFGKDVEVKEGEKVQGAAAIGGSVIVAGQVEGAATAIGGDVILKSSAIIDQDAVSIGGRVKAEPGAIIKGEIVEMKGISRVIPFLFGSEGEQILEAIGVGLLILRLSWLITFVLFAVLTGLLCPERIDRMSDALRGNALKIGLIGLLGLILLPPIILLLALTIIGLPFIPLLLLLVGFISIFGEMGICLLLGKKMLGEETASLKGIIIGAIPLGALVFIPSLGGIISSIAGIFGFGTALSTRLGKK